MNKNKNNKAITLIALVITIVVLIILAAVAINLSLGSNGIFNRAKTGKELYQNAESFEKDGIGKLANGIDSEIKGSREQIMVDKDEWEELKAKVNSKGTTVLFSAATDSKGCINAVSGDDASRTLSDNVNNYDYVIVYPGYYYNNTLYPGYYAPITITKHEFNELVEANVTMSSTYSNNVYRVQIDSNNNKIIFSHRATAGIVIKEVVGVKL